MNKSDLVAIIAKSAKISKATAEKSLNGFMGAIGGALAKGESVTLVGFGSFSAPRRAARVGRNPQTGAAIKIPAKKTVRFKAGKRLAEALS